MKIVKSFVRHARNSGRSIVKTSRRAVPVVAAAGVGLATIGSAHAETNAGVSAISSGISGLAPDLATIVTAAVIVSLVGIGATVALSLGKRLIGK